MDQLLLDTVERFQSRKHELLDAPQELIERYGLPALAQSLWCKQPEVPQVDKDRIMSDISAQEFPDLDSLINYAASQQNDLDKVFAIWYWEVLNVECPANTTTLDQSQETIFKDKKALREGYVSFLVEVSQKLGLTSVQVNKYSNYTKDPGYNAINPPEGPTANNLLALITVNGVPYVSDPTGGAGSVVGENFVRSVKVDHFLIPLAESIHKQFPIDEATDLLPAKMTWDQFVNVVAPHWTHIRAESHPQLNLECETGYLEQQFSYQVSNDAPADQHAELKEVMVQVRKHTGNDWEHVDAGSFTTTRVVDDNITECPGLIRFRTYIAFPHAGKYKLTIIFNVWGPIDYYVDVKQACDRESVPPLMPRMHHDMEKKVIFVHPPVLSKWESGVALLRFAVPTSDSKLHMIVHKVDDDYNKEECELNASDVAQTSCLAIPFDKTRYETWTTLTFPTDGKYKVNVWIVRPENMKYMTTYFLDVTGASQRKKVPPLDFMFSGRQFAPIIMSEHDPGLIVSPNESTVVHKKSPCVLEVKKLKPEDSVVVTITHVDTDEKVTPQDKTLSNGTRTYTWTPTKTGMWEITFWIYPKYIFNQWWFITDKTLPKPTQEEKKRMEDLVAAVASEKQDDDANKQSACCLLL